MTDTQIPGIMCPQCGMVSHHPDDIAHEYCGNCHQFHSNMKCHCGRPLKGHYNDYTKGKQVAKFVREHGPTIIVQVSDGTRWKVPRHYVALHGIKDDEVPKLGFEPADD